jgi:hypothetical protein
MANPLEKDLVDGSARAWMGGVEVILSLIPILVVVVVVVVVVVREVTTMATIAILIVATSWPGW